MARLEISLIWHLWKKLQHFENYTNAWATVFSKEHKKLEVSWSHKHMDFPLLINIVSRFWAKKSTSYTYEDFRLEEII